MIWFSRCYKVNKFKSRWARSGSLLWRSSTKEKSTRLLLKTTRRLTSSSSDYSRKSASRKRRKTPHTRLSQGSFTRSPTMRTPSTFESDRRLVLGSFKTKLLRFWTKKISSSCGICSKRTSVYLKIRPRGSITISSSMFRACCRQSAASSSRAQLSWNSRETNMAG